MMPQNRIPCRLGRQHTMISQMTNKILIWLFAVMTAVTGWAVDLNEIEVDVKMHPGKFRELLERFEQADTTLTPSELATVYFGYSYTPDYDPRETFPQVESAYDSGDYELTETLGLEAMELNPVSLDLNVLALAAADHMRDKGTYGPKILKYGIRCDLIATAILESGSGTTASSPFYVISSADMSRILRNVLGIDRIVDRTKVGDVDAIKVTFPGSDRQHILYFNNNRERQFFSSHPL